MNLSLKDFDYFLPPERIAQAPLACRSASRLLVLQPPADADGNDQLIDSHFSAFPQLVGPDDLLVFNDSRVIHARLHGRKASGGEIEMLVERVIGDHEVLAQIRASKSPRPGSFLDLGEAGTVEVLGRVDEFYHLRFTAADRVLDVLERHGKLPLPPYIARAAGSDDESRYQTVFAREPGSVAAPTAGLHFDDATLGQLKARGVRSASLTLHVGAGTFQPVRVDDLGAHRMHRERFLIPRQTVAEIERTRRAGGRVIAVGTTSLRALETAAAAGALAAGSGETELFILPGFRFRVVDALLTNFHLPRSTLLMLVSAFAGIDNIRNAYAHAIRASYRFFSYGDAMFLSHRHPRASDEI